MYILLRNLDEAVAATLELESFKSVKFVVKIARVQLDLVPLESHVFACSLLHCELWSMCVYIHVEIELAIFQTLFPII